MSDWERFHASSSRSLAPELGEMDRKRQALALQVLRERRLDDHVVRALIRILGKTTDKRIQTTVLQMLASIRKPIARDALVAIAGSPRDPLSETALCELAQSNDGALAKNRSLEAVFWEALGRKGKSAHWAAVGLEGVFGIRRPFTPTRCEGANPLVRTRSGSTSRMVGGSFSQSVPTSFCPPTRSCWLGIQMDAGAESSKSCLSASHGPAKLHLPRGWSFQDRALTSCSICSIRASIRSIPSARRSTAGSLSTREDSPTSTSTMTAYSYRPNESWRWRENITTNSRLGGVPVHNASNIELPRGPWRYAMHLGSDLLGDFFGDAASLHLWFDGRRRFLLMGDSA